jgi:hypothetical protein
MVSLSLKCYKVKIDVPMGKIPDGIKHLNDSHRALLNLPSLMASDNSPNHEP